MDAHIIQEIQREGAEALLNVGVSLPLKDFKVPFRKEPLNLRLTMKRPTMARQIQIARTWLSVGMTLEEFEALDYDGQMEFLAKHGKKLEPYDCPDDAPLVVADMCIVMACPPMDEVGVPEGRF